MSAPFPSPHDPVPDGPAARAEVVFEDTAISMANILAAVRAPLMAPKEQQLEGWFGATDFALCRRHTDSEGDRRDDNVFITVWKTWDFYLAVEQAPISSGLRTKWAATVLRRAVATQPQLRLLVRGYVLGEPGPWQTLEQDAHPQAWEACQQAWRGVLDYVQKAVAEHRARYPLYRRLQATVTAHAVERLTTLPVFTEHYNDWWDSERNGYWEGDLWVGARQPCMHDGEPWGRALKLSWANGDPAAGDAEDNAHSAYWVHVDEARAGPAVVTYATTQRQNALPAALPRSAADHIARLLDFFTQLEQRLGVGVDVDVAVDINMDAGEAAQTVQALQPRQNPQGASATAAPPQSVETPAPRDISAIAARKKD